jgi:hypothetical protein
VWMVFQNHSWREGRRRLGRETICVKMMLVEGRLRRCGSAFSVSPVIHL